MDVRLRRQSEEVGVGPFAGSGRLHSGKRRDGRMGCPQQQNWLAGSGCCLPEGETLRQG